jgi:hypothetical protein
MSDNSKIIELDKATRKLYSHYDFEYFLDRSLSPASVSQGQKAAILSSYKSEIASIRTELKKNKTQALYNLEGNIRKCHSGGVLPMLFNLSMMRGSGTYLDTQEMGKTWAYFEIWSKFERRQNAKKAFWDVVIKIGALLGFFATIMQIIQWYSN